MSHKATISQYKNPPDIGNQFTELMRVDSSNNYAMASIHDGKAFHGNVFFAHEQTAGKGQRGKKWIASVGENIQMSIVIEPKGLAVNSKFLLSTCIALGCYDLLNIYSPKKIFIKWPNDLYINDRKTGGILIENIISGQRWKYSVVGIGININQSEFDPSLPNPTSLKQATGKVFDVIALAKKLCIFINKRYDQLMNHESKKLIEDYNTFLYKRNEKIKLKKANQVFETTIKEVNILGNLVTMDVIQRSFEFGEVEWVT